MPFFSCSQLQLLLSLLLLILFIKHHSHSSPAGAYISPRDLLPSLLLLLLLLSPKLATRHVFFEVVEWSEQLRSVTSVWLGAAAAAFKSDSAPAGV